MNGPTGDDSTVTALAAQMERLQRAVDTLTARAATAEEQATDRAAALETRADETAREQAVLSEEILTLAEAVKKLARPPGPPGISWLSPPPARPDGPPPPTPEEVMEDLAAWLVRVYLRYTRSELPACWAWHPDVVEELLALRLAHHEALTARGMVGERMTAWHDRHRPGVVKRIAAAIGTCEMELHTAGGPHHAQPDPDLPLAQYLDLAAAVWADRRETPAPTALVLAAAMRYERRRRRDAS